MYIKDIINSNTFMFAGDANISAESPGQPRAVRCINIVIISTQAGGEGEGAVPEAQGTPLPPNKLTKINNFSTEAAVLNKHRLSYNGELSRQFVIPDFLLHFPLEVIVSVSVFIIVSCDIFRFPYCSLYCFSFSVCV